MVDQGEPVLEEFDLSGKLLLMEDNSSGEEGSSTNSGSSSGSGGSCVDSSSDQPQGDEPQGDAAIEKVWKGVAAFLFDRGKRSPLSAGLGGGQFWVYCSMKGERLCAGG